MTNNPTKINSKRVIPGPYPEYKTLRSGVNNNQVSISLIDSPLPASKV